MALHGVCHDSRTNCGKAEGAAWKTVLTREFPRAQPEGTSEGQFFQAAPGFSTVSQTLLTPQGSL